MSKCTKHISSGPLLEVKMSKKVHAVVARRTFPSQNVQNTACSRHFWRFGCYRRKFRSQTSDNMDRWDRWKAEQGRGREKRKIRREKIRRERVRRKKMQMRRKGRKVAKQCVFPMICGSGGSKSRLAKAAGAESAGQIRDENLHAVMARNTFWSQNIQNPPFSDHFWKFRCRKSPRCYGTKHILEHILESKYTKHTTSGPLLEVKTSKKYTPLWREVHFQVNMHKIRQLRTTWKFKCCKNTRRRSTKYISKLKCTKHCMFAPFLAVRMLSKEI